MGAGARSCGRPWRCRRLGACKRREGQQQAESEEKDTLRAVADVSASKSHEHTSSVRPARSRSTRPGPLIRQDGRAFAVPPVAAQRFSRKTEKTRNQHTCMKASMV